MTYINQMPRRALHTVVETPEFRRRSRKLLTDDERVALTDHLAATPEAGDIMQGCGGARKVRWAIGEKGKSGGVRVITFYSGALVPVFLLTLFGKGEKVDLSRGERNELRGVLAELVAAYREGVRMHVQGR